MLVALSLTTPVLADGGANGEDNAGGVDSATGTGGTGGSGGGGGAGEIGGAGARGLVFGTIPGGAGGAGGASAGASGSNGATNAGAGGGGGGAHGYVGAGLPTTAVLGGNGGRGGNGAVAGGGGAGGYGGVVTGTTGGSLSFTATGGNGGNGGNGAHGGSGGSGGIGLLFTDTVGSDVTIDAAVSGGNGGNGGNGADPGRGGDGGTGLLFTDMAGSNVTIGAAVSGGNGGNAGGGGGKGIGGSGGSGLQFSNFTGGTVTIDADVRGGDGGPGGSAGGTNGTGGPGGNGGDGLVFEGTGGATVIVNSAVNGGAGGAGGTATNPGTDGTGGAGIVGQNLSITMGTAGTVSGGSGANAITFTGGDNFLTFENATSGLTGNVDVTGSLALDQSSIDTVVDNAITGTGDIIKTGTAMVTLSGTNTYGGLTSVNAGTLRLLNGAAILDTGAVTIASGGTLNVATSETMGPVASSGIIDMVDSNTTQVTTVNGTYTGNAGSQLLVDINTDTAQADVLATTDASGTTAVSFNVLGNGFNQVTIVSQSTDTDAGETFAGSIASSGLFNYSFHKSGTSWVVTPNLDPALAASIVTNVSGALSALASSFHQPASNFVSYETSDPDQMACGMWARADGGRYDIDSTSALNFVGVGSLGSIGSSQRLRYAGGEVGFDCAQLNMAASGWNGHLGVNGGKIEGDITQLGGIGSTDLDVPFAGAYGFLTNGSLTFDLSARHDFNNLEITNTVGGLNRTKVDGDATTVEGSVHMRMAAGGGWFVTPEGGLSWTRYKLDDFAIESGTTPGLVSAGSDEALLGHIGVKLALVQQIASNISIAPFAGVTFWKDFKNVTDLNLTFFNANGTSTVTSQTEGPDNFTEYAGGFSFTDTGLGLTGYVQGTWRQGDELSGGSVTAGGRVLF